MWSTSICMQRLSVDGLACLHGQRAEEQRAHEQLALCGYTLHIPVPSTTGLQLQAPIALSFHTSHLRRANGPAVPEHLSQGEAWSPF